MLKELLDIVGEGEDIVLYERFSVMLGSVYILYVWFYYYLLKEIYKKLTFNAVAILSILHIFQVLGVKYLFNQGKIRYAWLVIFVPMLLFLIYQKYMERQAIIEQQNYLKFKAMMAREKAMNEPLDLVGAAPKPDYIIPEQKIAPQKQYNVMPQYGGQQSPPIPHYTGTSGAAPNQMYESGPTIPQYTAQTVGNVGYNESSFYQSSPEYQDPFDSSDYSLF